jgi:hypothetical protein
LWARVVVRSEVRTTIARTRRSSRSQLGSIKWAGGFVFVGEVMAQAIVGLKEIEDGRWLIYLGQMQLVVLHERSRTITSTGSSELQTSLTHVLGQPSVQEAQLTRGAI